MPAVRRAAALPAPSSATEEALSARHAGQSLPVSPGRPGSGICSPSLLLVHLILAGENQTEEAGAVRPQPHREPDALRSALVQPCVGYARPPHFTSPPNMRKGCGVGLGSRGQKGARGAHGVWGHFHES